MGKYKVNDKFKIEMIASYLREEVFNDYGENETKHKLYIEKINEIVYVTDEILDKAEKIEPEYKDGEVWWCQIDFCMTSCDIPGRGNQWPLVYCSKKNPKWPWKDNNGEYKKCHITPLWKMEKINNDN